MRYNIRNLQTLETVSRHRSISKAAAELGVSQSAVSHQIRNLTKEIGERLIFKSGSGIGLTDAAEQLAAILRDSFSGIESSVQRIIGGGRRTVRLAVCSAFAPGWLIHRLQNYFDTFPEFELQLRMYSSDPELSDNVADAFITTSHQEPGFRSSLIIEERLIGVCSAVNTSADNLDRLPLVTTQIDANGFGNEWILFAEKIGWSPAKISERKWLQCSHYMIALEMAKSGLGIALVPDFLADRHFDGGSLNRFHDIYVPTGRSYQLFMKHSRCNEPALESLAIWFKNQNVIL